MRDQTARWVSIAVLLVATVAIGGCLESIGEATQQAVSDGPAETSPAAPSDGVDGEEPITEETTAEPYEAALRSVQPGAQGPDRVAINLDVEPLAEGTPMAMHLLVDRDKRLTVASITNASEDPASATDKPDSFLLGAVHKTSFLGTDATLLGYYNESSTWSTAFGNLSQTDSLTRDQPGSSGSIEDPTRFLTALDEAPEDADVETTNTSYAGQPVTRIAVSWSNATSSVDATLLLDEDDRPLVLNATVTGNATGLAGQDSRVTMTFAYGDEASHPAEDTLYRAETMTLLASDGALSLSAGADTQNWTVQPSQNAGLIPLEAVEVHVRSGSGFTTSGDGETVIALPAEDRKVTTPNATVVYDDVDGDRKVSPGDVIRYTAHTDDAEAWSVSLYDEKTQTRMAPGPGVWLVLVSVGLLATVLRRPSD